MPDNLDTLTTEQPADVNVEEGQDLVSEDNPDVQSTNVEESDAYADAWNSVDVNDESSFDDFMGIPEEVSQDVADQALEVTPEGSNNNIGAFMTDKPVLKYKGQDIPIDSEEELIALAQKGFSYESEMSNIKPHKKALKAIEGVPLEVLQAVRDLNDGKAEAINYLNEVYGIQPVEAADDDSYFGDDKPAEKSAYRPEVKADDPVKDFWESYSQNNMQMAAKVSDVYAQLDSSFQTEVYAPGKFEAFVQSVSTGEFEKVFPLAIKTKSLNPGLTWIQAYAHAAQNGLPQTPPTVPAGVQTPESSIPTVSVGSQDKADRVWNDPDYFDEVGKKLFG